MFMEQLAAPYKNRQKETVSGNSVGGFPDIVVGSVVQAFLAKKENPTQSRKVLETAWGFSGLSDRT